MKKIIYMAVALLCMLASCESMEDNYKEYLENTKQYSPAIRNLKKVESLRTIELMWENPPGDLAEKIQIITGDEGRDPIVIDEMVEYYKLEELEIRGYDISVYTIDKYGNYSIPVSISAFPGTPEQ